MEKYLRVNLFGSGPRVMKKGITGPRSHCCTPYNQNGHFTGVHNFYSEHFRIRCSGLFNEMESKMIHDYIFSMYLHMHTTNTEANANGIRNNSCRKCVLF